MFFINLKITTIKNKKNSFTINNNKIIMKLNLLSCDDHRPDRRAIAKCISEISSNIDESLSKELTNIFIEGDIVDIEIVDRNSGSALRALRKLNIDYKIIE